MVKSETTIRRELKAVREKLCHAGDLTNEECVELAIIRVTLQWVLGQINVEYGPLNIPPTSSESRRPVLWVTDRSGSAVD